jgi:hypothetical protein
MIPGLWVDYSAGRPGGAALDAANVVGVFRYVSAGSAGKLITAAEYADLVAHGIAVLLVYEYSTHDAEGGFTAGAAHAQAALSTARAYGIPDTVGIAAACDEHLSAAQVPTAIEYVAGFVSVLELPRTGAYGPAELIDAVHSANAAGWTWKWGSAPTAAEQQWLTFWQRNAAPSTIVIGGVTCDRNDQYNPIPGGTMSDPIADQNTADLEGYVFKGGANTRSWTASVVPDGCDESSLFGRVVDLQNGVTQCLAALSALAAAVAKLTPTTPADGPITYQASGPVTLTPVAAQPAG